MDVSDDETAAALNRVADALLIHAAELRRYTAQVHELIVPSGDGPDPMDAFLDAARTAAREAVTEPPTPR